MYRNPEYESACLAVQNLLCDPTNLDKVLRGLGLSPKPKRGGGFSMSCPLHRSTDGEPLNVSINGVDSLPLPIVFNCHNSSCSCPHDIVSFVRLLKGHQKAAPALTELANLMGFPTWRHIRPAAYKAVVHSQGITVPTPSPQPILPLAKLNSAIPSVGTKPISGYLVDRREIARDVVRLHGCYDCPCDKSYHEGRVVIPVADLDGKQVGLMSRTLKDYCPQCKWHHHPKVACQTGHRDRFLFDPGFQKGNYLFNLDRAVRTGSSSLIVCEGPLDVMRLESCGIHSVVALMGSKPSEAQLQTIMGLPVGMIYSALDMDRSGEEGSRMLRDKLKVFSHRRLLMPANDPGALSYEQIRTVFGNI